jgi:hypothetical protein
MISANKLVYDFYRKRNSQNSGKAQSYRVVDIVAYLNEAYEIWYENKVSVAQKNEKLRNDLRQFFIIGKELDVKEIDCDTSRVVYPSDLYQRMNQEALTCSKDCCPGIEKKIDITISLSDKIRKDLRDSNWMPDFKWERLLAQESGDGMVVYHKGMDVKKVIIDYYRKPNFIEAPELVQCEMEYYNYDNEVIKKNLNFEVDSTFANRQVSDLAVLLSSRDSMDTESFNSQVQKILQIDKLYRA